MQAVRSPVQQHRLTLGIVFPEGTIASARAGRVSSCPSTSQQSVIDAAGMLDGKDAVPGFVCRLGTAL